MAIKSTLDNGVRDIWNMVLGGLVKFGALFLHLFVLDGGLTMQSLLSWNSLDR